MLAHLFLLTASLQDIQFEPLIAGNQIIYDEFTITVPEGIFYATEENAHLMLPLLKYHHLENMIGVFYDSNANWDWAVALQYFPDQVANTTIKIEPEPIEKFFLEQAHLHFLNPLSESAEATLSHPFYINGFRNMFEIAVQYSNVPGNQLGYFSKKVFMGSSGTLVMHTRIAENGYIDRIDKVNRIYDESVTITPREPTEKVITKPFPDFLGISIKETGQQFTPEELEQALLDKLELEKELTELKLEEEIEPVNWWLMGGAIALLAIAFGLKAVMKKG